MSAMTSNSKRFQILSLDGSGIRGLFSTGRSLLPWTGQEMKLLEYVSMVNSMRTLERE